VQFAKEGDDWNSHYFREQDKIVNESALYPRPRMNKRDVAVHYDNRTMDDVTVVGLPPNATVLIQIRVLTKYFLGPASDPVRVTTLEGGTFDSAVDVDCVRCLLLVFVCERKLAMMLGRTVCGK